MKERPIIFSGEMVKAILEGRKTQTRRLIKIAPGESYCTRCRKTTGECVCSFKGDAHVDRCTKRASSDVASCPYGKPGDRLWVRESFREYDMSGDKMILHTEPWEFGFEYKADLPVDLPTFRYSKWKPSIYMPRIASRITLEIVSAHAERLQVITEADASAEGVEPTIFTTQDIEAIPPDTDEGRFARCLGPGQITAKFNFQELWDKINGKRAPWESNPWVWVIEFRRVEAA